jgi:hypothetical protein
VSLLRICVVGDGLVSGIGDPRGLGWTGRVAARTQAEPGTMAMFSLGVPDESTSALLTRWRAEAYPRFATDADNRLVVSPGRSDLGAQLSLARSRLNLANILDDARSDDVRALVVGPVPGADPADHERTGGLNAGTCPSSTVTPRSVGTSSGSPISPSAPTPGRWGTG